MCADDSKLEKLAGESSCTSGPTSDSSASRMASRGSGESRLALLKGTPSATSWSDATASCALFGQAITEYYA
eukprot:2009263-Alexandrium_andersonii.AAC.1